ncbi:MAG: LysM peptidoglycan-binding domain-containing protein [Bacillota bacterium]
MGYTITQDYLPKGSLRRAGIRIGKILFLTGHDTGNDNSTAKQNVKYYKDSANVMEASAHTFIDEHDIIECVPLDEKAWHVRYLRPEDNEMFGDDANDVAIGVELCYSTSGKFDTKKAYTKYVWYLAYLCKKYGLDPRTKIVGHETLDPGRKTDPTNALKTIGKSFKDLIADVYAEYLVQTGQKVTAVSKPSSSVYTVIKGDTLWGISKRFGMTSAEIIELNPGINPSVISIGQKINIAGTLHTIKKGDTLWDIAQAYKVDVAAIEKSNPTVNPKTLQIGQVIKVPKASVKQPEKPKPAPKPKKLSESLPTATLRKGSKGSGVLTVQKGLAGAYFYPDKGAKNDGCDGVFGAKTQYALKRFQMVYTPYDVDGVYGPETRKKLAEVLRKNGK